jgi:hypothetical protein
MRYIQKRIMQPETTLLSNVLHSNYLTKDLQKYHASYCTNETLVSLRVVEQVDVVVTIENGRYLV